MSDQAPPGDGKVKGTAKVPGREPLRPPLPKRFYNVVEVGSDPAGLTPARAHGVRPAGSDPGHRVLLDKHPIKTPKKRPLALPTLELAEAIAAEWSAQREVIDPAAMPLTRIANSAIDAVADHMSDVAADIAAFAASDLLCYRAEGPSELIARQAAAWDPVLVWAEPALGARFQWAAGVMPIEQSETVRAGVLRALASAGPFRLAALHVLTTLSGSALLALAHAEGVLNLDESWSATHIDEDWQIEQWGGDAEASERRAFRRGEFSAASRMLELLGPGSP